MQSSEKSVAAYLKSLPPERAAVISQIRSLVNKHIKTGFAETMRWGMISWEIPLKRYPITYNKQPLNYIALAAQKNNYSLYLMGCYTSPATRKEFEEAYRAAGKRLDMGKSCIRFKEIEDLPIKLIKKQIKKHSVTSFIRLYESTRNIAKDG